jgi:polar amino acid transport system substrate-binding protein
MLVRLLWVGVLLLVCRVAGAVDLRAVTLLNEPYAFRSGDEVAGISVDLIREMGRRLGKTVDVDILPWARALSESREGRADIILNVVLTPERQQYLDYIPTPVTTEEAVFIVTKDSPLHFDGRLEPLRGRVVGAGRGFRFGDPVDRAFATGLLLREDHDSVEVMLRKLLLGRLDVMVVDRTLGVYEMHLLGMAGQFRVLQPAMTHVPSYFAVSRSGKAAGLARQFDKVLKQMIEDGSFARIRAKYVPDD